MDASGVDFLAGDATGVVFQAVSLMAGSGCGSQPPVLLVLRGGGGGLQVGWCDRRAPRREQRPGRPLRSAGPPSYPAIVTPPQPADCQFIFLDTSVVEIF